MDPRHVNLLNENKSELVEKTCDIEKIVNRLAEMKILNHYMVRQILKSPDRKKQNTEFYTMIPCRGPTAFDSLVQVLRETQNEDAAMLLTRTKVSFFYPTSETKIRSCSPTPDDDLIDYCDVANLVVKTDPEKKFMDIVKSSPSGKKAYTMRSKPRGLALIINIFKCPNPEKNRTGSHLDAEKVKKLFTEIGYKVIPLTDLTRKEMKNEIKAFSMNKELLKVDSLVVFIMCHGQQYQDTDEVELAAADGSCVTTRWIINQFTDQNSSFVSFRNKPKLFFFQSCRVIPDESNEKIPHIKSSRDKSRQKLGEIKNTIVVYSTCTGTPSMRDVKEGTWFVAEFCRVVAENAWRYDLDTMLDMVNEAVGKKKDPRFGSQSMEVKKLGISGKIYFNPGL